MGTTGKTKRKNLPDKHAVRDALRESMQAALVAIAQAAKDAAKGATHEENRAEGDKDMRATEQSYIARGQAMRAEELAEHLQRLENLEIRAFSEEEAIAPGALVRVLVDGSERLFLMVPWGGGTEISVEDTKITVITPASPVGRALLGRRLGDEFELSVKGTMREWEIEAIA
jgi:transcription elongation GreA/GreB family factor